MIKRLTGLSKKMPLGEAKANVEEEITLLQNMVDDVIDKRSDAAKKKAEAKAAAAKKALEARMKILTSEQISIVKAHDTDDGDKDDIAIRNKIIARLRKLASTLKGENRLIVLELIANLKDDIGTMMDQAAAKLEQEKEKFKNGFESIAREALAAFDKVARDWKPPSLALYNKNQLEHDKQQLIASLHDAERAVEDARKSLADAMAGPTIVPSMVLYNQNQLAHDEAAMQDQLAAAQQAVEDAKKGLQDAMSGYYVGDENPTTSALTSNSNAQMDKVRALLTQFTSANELDKVQSGILGIAHKDQFGEGFANQLRDIVSGTGDLSGGGGPSDVIGTPKLETAAEKRQRAIDEANKRIVDAEKNLQELRFQIQQSGLRKQADAEQAAVDRQSAIDRANEQIIAAEQRLADVRFQISQQALQELIAVEQAAHDIQTAVDRAFMENSLNAWRDYYAGLVAAGMSAQEALLGMQLAALLPAGSVPGQPVSIFGNPNAGIDWGGWDGNVFNIPGGGGSAPAPAPAPAPAAPIMGVVKPRIGRPGDEMGFFAEGGVAERPTLGVFGERGREALIPLDDPRYAGMMHGDTHVDVNVANGMEWLKEFISIHVDSITPRISRNLGRQADIRQRSKKVGRF